MEHLYRIIFLIIFLLGFMNFAKADNANLLPPPPPTVEEDNSMGDLVSDIRLAQDVNEMNSANWMQDSYNVNDDSLGKLEAILKAENKLVVNPEKPNTL